MFREFYQLVLDNDVNYMCQERYVIRQEFGKFIQYSWQRSLKIRMPHGNIVHSFTIYNTFPWYKNQISPE